MVLSIRWTDYLASDELIPPLAVAAAGCDICRRAAGASQKSPQMVPVASP